MRVRSCRTGTAAFPPVKSGGFSADPANGQNRGRSSESIECHGAPSPQCGRRREPTITHDSERSPQRAKPRAFSMGNTSSTTSKVTCSAGAMASRLSIAVYRWSISCKTSASVTRRSPAAIRRSRMTCASVLCGWAAPIRYIGILETTKIILAHFPQHLLNVGGGERVLCATPNRLQLGFGVNLRPAGARVPKGTPDPLTHCQTFTLGQTLDVRHFGIGKQYLKTLAHRVSIAWSLAE